MLRVRNGLKHLAGVGRPELTQTPKETVWSSEKVELWRYTSDRRTIRTPLLFVHSLVSRSYVFDLVPGNSVVETMVDRGFDVFLVDWGVPDELEAGNTLETYTDDYLPTDHRARSPTISGSPDVNVFGYCFGGVLSLLSVAGNPDLPVRSLAVMATPVDFTHMGPMASMMQEGRVDPADLLDATGNVPADVMRNSFRVLQPLGDVTGYVNLWQNLWNDDFVAAHQVMTQWSRRPHPVPRRGVRADRRAVRPAEPPGDRPRAARRPHDRPRRHHGAVPQHHRARRTTSCPPEAIEVLTTLVGSDDVEELRLPAGHVGLVVGRTAQRRNLPAMADWLERHAEPL